MIPFDSQRLAGVTHLSVTRGGKPPLDVYVFDPHRLALPCWALGGTGGTLVSLDRHFDLAPPALPCPAASAGVRALDEHARYVLDARNVDHVLAALEAGVIDDAVVLARAAAPGAIEADAWRDRHGATHRLIRLTRPAELSLELGATAGTPAAEARALIERAERVLLDVDLDCFTTPSDADATAVVPWTEELVRDFLLPSDALWAPVHERLAAVTIAREPVHTGGLIASAQLFEAFARVFFGELLGADLP